MSRLLAERTRGRRRSSARRALSRWSTPAVPGLWQRSHAVKFTPDIVRSTSRSARRGDAGDRRASRPRGTATRGSASGPTVPHLEPFFRSTRLDPLLRGTGLGLARPVLLRPGRRIWVDSTPGSLSRSPCRSEGSGTARRRPPPEATGSTCVREDVSLTFPVPRGARPGGGVCFFSGTRSAVRAAPGRPSDGAVQRQSMPCPSHPGFAAALIRHRPVGTRRQRHFAAHWMASGSRCPTGDHAGPRAVAIAMSAGMGSSAGHGQTLAPQVADCCARIAAWPLHAFSLLAAPRGCGLHRLGDLLVAARQRPAAKTAPSARRKFRKWSTPQAQGQVDAATLDHHKVSVRRQNGHVMTLRYKSVAFPPLPMSRLVKDVRRAASRGCHLPAFARQRPRLLNAKDLVQATAVKVPTRRVERAAARAAVRAGPADQASVSTFKQKRSLAMVVTSTARCSAWSRGRAARQLFGAIRDERDASSAPRFAAAAAAVPRCPHPLGPDHAWTGRCPAYAGRVGQTPTPCRLGHRDDLPRRRKSRRARRADPPTFPARVRAEPPVDSRRRRRSRRQRSVRRPTMTARRCRHDVVTGPAGAVAAPRRGDHS